MTERSTATTAPMRTLTPVPTFDDLALACCGRRHVDLVSDPKSFPCADGRADSVPSRFPNSLSAPTSRWIAEDATTPIRCWCCRTAGWKGSIKALLYPSVLALLPCWPAAPTHQ